MNIELLTNRLLLRVHDDVIYITNVGGGQHAWCVAVAADAVRSLPDRLFGARGLHMEIGAVLLTTSLLSSTKKIRESVFSNFGLELKISS